MDSVYKKEQEKRLLEKYAAIKKSLPEFVVQYLGTKHQATTSTKLLYANHFLCFFKYVCIADENLCGKEPTELTIQDIENYTTDYFDAYVSYLRENTENGHKGHNRNSVEHRLVPIRGLYKYYSETGVISKNPLFKYERFKEPESKTIIHLSDDEVGDVLETVTEGTMKMTPRMQKFYEKTQYRDAAIFALLLGTGIRVSELVGADISDLNGKAHSLAVVRKGEHTDVVYFNNDTQSALELYIENERPTYAKKKDSPALFLSLRGTRLSVDSVEQLVKKYTSGVVNKKITPHKLRATYGTALYQQSHDLGLVQDALGHASPVTTKKYYVNSREENMKRAGTIDIYGEK